MSFCTVREIHGLDSRSVQAMAEAEVDISGYQSKHLKQLKSIKFDYVVTVCDNTHEQCLVFPNATRVLHIGFDDPPILAKHVQTEQERLNHYRRVRDEIREFVTRLPEVLIQTEKGSKSV